MYTNEFYTVRPETYFKKVKKACFDFNLNDNTFTVTKINNKDLIKMLSR